MNATKRSGLHTPRDNRRFPLMPVRPLIPVSLLSVCLLSLATVAAAPSSGSTFPAGASRAGAPAGSPPPGSQWRSQWGLGQDRSQTAPRTGDAAVARLRLVPQGDRLRAEVQSDLNGPVQVELRARDPSRDIIGLPVRTLVNAGRGSTVVAQLQPQGRGGPLDLVLEAVPGQPGARHTPFAYRLPFAGEKVQVSQAGAGRFSHEDAENRDAVDFPLPEGTPILAARGGLVMQAVDQFDSNGLDPARDRGRANFIRLLHDDGSMAVYAHLQHRGVLVRQGQRIEQGQRIALSGNTGYSTAPHLHFVVQVNAGMVLQSVPFQMFSSRGELRFARDEGSADTATAPAAGPAAPGPVPAGAPSNAPPAAPPPAQQRAPAHPR